MYDFSVVRLFRSPAGVFPLPCFSSARYRSARLDSNIARCVPASYSFLYCDGANTTPLALSLSFIPARLFTVVLGCRFAHALRPPSLSSAFIAPFILSRCSATSASGHRRAPNTR
eukprot:scaffold4899_cov35-Phaeocystis_antarctica.AAC.1